MAKVSKSIKKAPPVQLFNSTDKINAGQINMNPTKAQNLTLGPEKAVYIFWIAVDILVTFLIYRLIIDKHTPISSKIFIIIMFVSLFGITNWLQFKIRLYLRNGELIFTDALRSKWTAKKVTLRLDQIQSAYLGMPPYLSKKFGALNPTPGIAASAATAGLFSAAAAGGIAARAIEPFFVFKTKSDEVYVTSAKPYSLPDCKKLLDALQTAGIIVEIQDLISKRMKPENINSIANM